MKDLICLIWDLLHFIGIILVITFPYKTCITAVIVALVWKQNYEIVRNITCFILWWSLTSIHGVKYGLSATFILFLTSPRAFNEIFNNTLTVQCTWILNAIYPIIYPDINDEEMKLKTSNVYNSDDPTVLIILCNKDEALEVLDQSIKSIIDAKDYAERMLNINRIKIILADGGSRNIHKIRNAFGAIFDSIEVIPGGKLSGRHYCSVKETSDIIVAYDSDRMYGKRNTFELLFPIIQDWKKYNRNGEEKESVVVGTTHYVNSDGVIPFNGGNSAYQTV